MTRSSLCDYKNAYMRVKGNITIQNTAAAGGVTNNANKKVVFKSWLRLLNP